MNKKDAYLILGISLDASEEEIKRAYKNLAKKMHPDINKDEGAEDKFKEINEAYDYIINKRQETQPQQQGFPFGGPINIRDFMNQFQVSKRRFDVDIHIAVGISFMEACLGIVKTFTYNHLLECVSCKEYKAKNNHYNTKSCLVCKGSGQLIQRLNNFIVSKPCGSCDGEGTKLECSTCNGIGAIEESKTFNLTIPEGIRPESILRVSGMGNFDYENESYGNVLIHVQIYNDTNFTREDDNIFAEFELDYLNCLLGGEFPVPTIHGNANLRVPECIQHGTVLKIDGFGIRRVGNHYVTIKIKMPQFLDKKTRKALTNLKKNRKL